MREYGNKTATLVNNARKKMGLTQRQLSQKLGMGEVNGQFISNIERGLALIPKERMCAISRVLKLSRTRLLNAIISDIRYHYKNR